MSDITFSVVDAGSGPARAAMGKYFAELDERFAGGFDASDAFDEAHAKFNPPNGLFVVAERDGATVGCGAIQHLDATTAEIKRMWVGSSTRGLGIGARLLAHLEKLIGESGRRRVVLDTNESLSEAIAMYASKGYSAIARYNDNPYAHHWFEKLLAPGSD